MQAAPSARAVIEPELAPGERLLWVGQPNPRRLLDRSDFIVIPFSLYWNGFMAFFAAHVIGSLVEGRGRVYPDLLLTAVVGIPFLLIGLYLLVGRFYHRAWTRRRTWYGLTQQRAIAIRHGVFWRSTNAANLRALGNVTAKLRRDGSGSVTFLRRRAWWAWLSSSGGPLDDDSGDAPVFHDIPDASRVVEALRGLSSGGAQSAEGQSDRPMPPVPAGDRAVLSGLLWPGEELLWVGRPDPHKHFTPMDIFMVPFSLLWGGFMILGLVGVIGLFDVNRDPGSATMAPFGIFMGLFALYVMVGRFVYKAFRKRGIVYALTTSRALVLDGSGRVSGKPVLLETLPSISASVRRDGSGSVTFGGSGDQFSRVYANTGLEFFTWTRSQAPAFFDIPDARTVMKLVGGVWADASRKA